MLERFRLAKEPEIRALREAAAQGRLPGPSGGVRPGFSAALRKKRPLAFIAEYKRASPSRGAINLSLTPEAAAESYARAGAAALSVLTEAAHFQGSLDFLAAMAGCGLPLLRKDFLFDPVQVAETAATKASALLLITRMFADAAGLGEMLGLCAAAGLEAVTEVFDARDLALAREAGAGIIQVNNRDLATLRVDLGNSRRLAAQKLPHELWISASGIEAPEQAREMAALGFDAVLVGSSLMAAQDPGAALTRLAQALERA